MGLVNLWIDSSETCIQVDSFSPNLATAATLTTFTTFVATNDPGGISQVDIVFGDGNTVTAVAGAVVNGFTTYTADNTYAAAGSYCVAIIVTTDDGTISNLHNKFVATVS